MKSGTSSAKDEKSPAPRHLGDVMTADPVCAASGASLRDVARLLVEYEISGVPVVDDQERLIGVVSRTDLLRRLLEGPNEARHDEDWLDLLTADSAKGTASGIDLDAARIGTVDDVMSVEMVTAKAEEKLTTVAHRMAEERVHRVIVVDPEGHPVGIATTLDLLRHFPV